VASAPSAAQAQKSAVDGLAHERFVEAFLSQSSRSQLAIIPVSALVAYLWFEPTRSAWPWLWWMLVCAFSLWRYWYTAAVVRSPDAVRTTRRITWLLLASGTLLALPLLAFHQLTELGRGILTLVLVGTATASVITTWGFRNVFMAFATPMLAPLAAAWLLMGGMTQQFTRVGLGLVILLFLWFLRYVGQHASTVFLEGCAYRFGEQQLNQELKLALARADEANSAKTQFLAAASHDLRQPIHSMNVLVAALSLRTLDASSQEIVGLLGSVNQVLSKQLDTLLDISKLDAGVVHAELDACCLDALVHAHQATITPLAAQSGLSVTASIDNDVWVRTDAALLTRALSNLTDNAIKYTPRGGSLHLTVQRLGDQALLAVHDSGIGIAEPEQERVFREFYQVGNVERDRTKGLGLGLSIVRRLCKLLNVEVKLQSAPGQGTAVSLVLPLCAPKVGVVDSVLSTRPHAPGLRVLVVDDEDTVRESMRLLLQGLGCRVFIADGLAQAQALVREQTLDILLCDLRLRGGENGLHVIQCLRGVQADLPAVLITGDTEPARIKEAQAAGVPLLFKPVSLDDLIDVLQVQANRAREPHDDKRYSHPV
jgi:signal transduction histidine kinase/ActR/RegA family two-component response regulator